MFMMLNHLDVWYILFKRNFIAISHRISDKTERTIRSQNADLFDRPVLRVRLLFYCFNGN